MQPSNAFVAGGYFNASLTKVLFSVSVKFVRGAINLLYEDAIVASSIFLLYKCNSKALPFKTWANFIFTNLYRIAHLCSKPKRTVYAVAVR